MKSSATMRAGKRKKLWTANGDGDKAAFSPVPQRIWKAEYVAGMISRKAGAGENGDTVTVRCCTVRMLSHVCLRRNFFLQMSRTKIKLKRY